MIRLKPSRIDLTREEAMSSLVKIPIYRHCLQGFMIQEEEKHPVISIVQAQPKAHHRESNDEASDADTIVYRRRSLTSIMRASTPEVENIDDGEAPQITVHSIGRLVVVGDESDEEENFVEDDESENEAVGPEEDHSQDDNDDDDDDDEEEEEIEEDADEYDEWDYDDDPGDSLVNSEEEDQDQVDLVPNPPPRVRVLQGEDTGSLHYQATSHRSPAPQEEENPFVSLLEMVTPAQSPNRPPQRPSRRPFFGADPIEERLQNLASRTVHVISNSAPNSPMAPTRNTQEVGTPVREAYIFEDLDPEAVSPSRSRFRLRMRQRHIRRRGPTTTPEMENHDNAQADDEEEEVVVVAVEAALSATGPHGELLVTPPRRL